jgi:fluoride exporter
MPARTSWLNLRGIHLVRDVVFVAIGGMLGALARYAVGLLSAHWLGKSFPWGTLLVNVAGCFAMGIVLQIMAGLESRPPETVTGGMRTQLAFWHKAVSIGFLGGLTTFSSFGGDTLRTLQAGQPLVALTNVAANVILSLAAVWCGSTLVASLD